MKLKTIFILPFLMNILLSGNIFAQVEQQLRVDPDNSQGGNFSDFFDEIDFIPLETNKHSIFSSIDQLEVTNDHFIILDRETNAVLIFNRKGGFESKIIATTLGYDYPIHYFFYDRGNQRIILPNPVKRDEILIFDLRGQIIKKEKTTFNNFEDLYFLKNGDIAHYNYNVDGRRSSSTSNEVFIENSGKIKSRYFPYNTKTAVLKSAEVLENSHANFYRTANDSAALLVRPYDYHIYRLSNNCLDTIFSIVLPLNHTLPSNFRSDSTFTKTRFKYLRSNPQIVFNLSNVYLIGNKLFIKLQNLDKSYSLFYDIKTGIFADVLKITADHKSSFLSFNDAILGGPEFFNKNFLHGDGTFLYTSYSASRFLNQKTENKDKIIDYPPHLEKNFRSLNAQSNPIIIQLKPKLN